MIEDGEIRMGAFIADITYTILLNKEQDAISNVPTSYDPTDT
jgi:hypothetical protein